MFSKGIYFNMLGKVLKYQGGHFIHQIWGEGRICSLSNGGRSHTYGLNSGERVDETRKLMGGG